MHYRRTIALLLTLLIGVAVCAPQRADDGTGAIRYGKHVSRGTVQALVVRAERNTRHHQAGHRRGSLRVWSAGSHEGPTHSMAAWASFPIRSVDTLPSYWGARHLTI